MIFVKNNCTNNTSGEITCSIVAKNHTLLYGS